MKVLQINKFYYRRRGAETYMLDLIELLEEKQNQVSVFSMNHPENIKSEYNKYFLSNIEYGDINGMTYKDKWRSVSRVLWSREAQKQLEKLIKDYQPKIAHIHNIYHQISPSILLTLKKHNIPVIHTLHDYKILSANYKLLVDGEIFEKSKGNKYYHEFLKKSVKNSYSASFLGMVEMYLHKYMKVYENNVDCFISPSRFLKNKMQEWQIKPKRIEVVPNFIDANKIKPNYTKTGYLLYFGGLAEEKGIDTLLDSLDDIGYDLSLHIAGTGPEEERLKKQAAGKNVTWLGHLRGEQLAQEIAGALIVVVPSRWYENYPYSVIEAFAYGKPVIAANIGGLPELVQPGKTGWLFSPNQADLLADIIKFAIQHPEKVEQLGRQARQWVEQELSPEKHFQRIYEIYSDYVST